MKQEYFVIGAFVVLSILIVYKFGDENKYLSDERFPSNCRRGPSGQVICD